MATRSAPARAKRRAIARPIPREPPVTRTFTASGPCAGRSRAEALASRKRPIGRGGARDLCPAGACGGLARSPIGLRGGVTETVEQLDLLLGIASELVV